MIEELVRIQNIRPITKTFSISRISTYLSYSFFMAVRLMALSMFMKIFAEYIGLKFKYLHPEYNNTQLLEGFMPIFIMLVVCCLIFVEPVYCQIKRILRDLHPKWEIENKRLDYLRCAIVSIPLFCVFDIFLDYVKMENLDSKDLEIINQFKPIIIKYTKALIYSVFLSVIFIFIISIIFYANKTANILYTKKYAKLKFYANKHQNSNV